MRHNSMINHIASIELEATETKSNRRLSMVIDIYHDERRGWLELYCDKFGGAKLASSTSFRRLLRGYRDIVITP